MPSYILSSAASTRNGSILQADSNVPLRTSDVIPTYMQPSAAASNSAGGASSASSQNPAVQVFLDGDTVKLLPGVKPKIEFALSKNFDNVYLVFDTQHYVCTRKLNNYISDEINVTGAGEYNVDVLSGGQKVADFKIKIVKGIEENKFDI